MAASPDRTELVQKAAAHLHRGELDKALSHYVSLFKRDPSDWNIANTLGDLYVRMGKASEAVDHFSALAERLASDGFTAKARALYRKILRIQPQNEMARHRVDELDKPGGAASPFLQRVLETARSARDSRQVTPPQPEPESAAVPLAATEPPPAAETPVAAEPPAAPLRIVASPPEAETAAPIVPDKEPETEPIESVPAPSAAEIEVSVDLSGIAFADTEPAAELAAAPHARASEPEATVVHDAHRERDPGSDVRGESPVTEDLFSETAIAAEAAAARREYTVAAAAIERFLAAHPHHIAALETLIDVGVEGGLDATLVDAQVRLTEACLEAGDFDRARDIAVDLVFRDPAAERYLTLLDRVLAASKARGRNIRIVPRELLPDVEAPQATTPAPAQVVPLVPVEPLAPRTDTRAEQSAHDDLPADLREWSDPDQAFDDLRTTLLEEAAAAAEERVAEAERLIQGHQYEEAVRSLEEAMCAPHLRAPAGARLARLYRDIREPMEALACLEWVAEVPPASADHGHELAYELAVTLEALGQQDQALGIYRELLAEVGSSYRDIAKRTERLAAA